jgi:hypothetical protein
MEPRNLLTINTTTIALQALKYSSIIYLLGHPSPFAPLADVFPSQQQLYVDDWQVPLLFLPVPKMKISVQT